MGINRIRHQDRRLPCNYHCDMVDFLWWTVTVSVSLDWTLHNRIFAPNKQNLCLSSSTAYFTGHKRLCVNESSQVLMSYCMVFQPKSPFRVENQLNSAFWLAVTSVGFFPGATFPGIPNYIESLLCFTMSLNKMRQKAPITEETPIRQLPYSVQKQISSHLDIDKQWERLVVNVPKKLQDLGNPDCAKRYSYLQVRLFDDKSKRPDGSPTRSILGKSNFNHCFYCKATYYFILYVMFFTLSDIWVQGQLGP